MERVKTDGPGVSGKDDVALPRVRTTVPRVGGAEQVGVPRIPTQLPESIDLWVAYQNAQEASVAEFLETYKPAKSVGASSKFGLTPPPPPRGRGGGERS